MVEERDVRGQEDLLVTHLADHQLVPFHAAVALHKDLVTQVVADVLSLQPEKNIHQLAVIVIQIFVLFIVVADPRRGLSVHDQGVAHDLTLSEEHADAGHGVVEHLVVGPPGLLAVHRGRVVTLADAAQGVALQMLAQKVDTPHHHPLVVALELVVSDVVTTECEGLRQNLLLAGLCGGGGQLCHSQAGPDRTAEPVHSGDVQILIVGHAGAVGGQLDIHGFLQHQMTGKLQVMRAAPVVDLLHEVL